LGETSQWLSLLTGRLQAAVYFSSVFPDLKAGAIEEDNNLTIYTRLNVFYHENGVMLCKIRIRLSQKSYY
jgi:hypothetical protein